MSLRPSVRTPSALPARPESNAKKNLTSVLDREPSGRYSTSGETARRICSLKIRVSTSKEVWEWLRVRACRLGGSGVVPFQYIQSCYTAEVEDLVVRWRLLDAAGDKWSGFSTNRFQTKGLILAQNERWRRGLGMQVARERLLREPSKVANG